LACVRSRPVAAAAAVVCVQGLDVGGRQRDRRHHVADLQTEQLGTVLVHADLVGCLWGSPLDVPRLHDFGTQSIVEGGEERVIILIGGRGHGVVGDTRRAGDLRQLGDRLDLGVDRQALDWQEVDHGVWHLGLGDEPVVGSGRAARAGDARQHCPAGEGDRGRQHQLRPEPASPA
jgi:hypothetical protein